MTIRAAMQQLRSDGLVHAEHGRGVFVSKGMTGSKTTVQRLAEPDSRVLDVTWSPGVVHLHVNNTEVLTLSPAAADWLARNAGVCASAAAEATAVQSYGN